MAFEAEFLALMPYTITRSTRTAMNQYGVRTWSTSHHSYRCRVVVRQSEVRQPNGQALTSQATVWVASTGTSLSAEDRWTLPAGILPTTEPAILMAEMFPDNDGPHHWKLSCGW